MDLLKWTLTGEKKKWPKWVAIKQQKVPHQRVGQKQLSATFINHATVLVQLDGLNIITDPIWSKRTSPLSWIGPQRVKLPGVKFEDLPKIDVILISHNHYDHMDIKTIERIRKRDNPKIILGIGNSYYLDKALEEDVIELDWNQKYTIQNTDFFFLPSQHWSKRGINDRNKCLWGAFAIIGKHKVYFAGDTGYSSHFKDAQKKFKNFNLALLPIGAYEPRWFMKASHMNPKEAYRAHRDLKTDVSIAIHFGTFRLTNEGINDPVNELKKVIRSEEIQKNQEGRKNQENRFIVLQNGETFEYKRKHDD